MEVSLLRPISKRMGFRPASLISGLSAAALVLVAVSAGCSRSLVGKKAPPFELKDCRGKVVRLEDFKGKVVLLHFFATWAPPCRIMMPNLSYLQAKLKREPFQVVGIAVEDDSRQVARQAAGVNYLVLHGDEKTVKSYFGSETLVLPVSFLVDADGVVAQKFVGYYEGEEISVHARRLIDKSSGAK